MAYVKLEDINVTDVSDILTYPLTGDFFFWGKILFALFWVFTLTLFFEEKKRSMKGNILASAAVSSIGIIVLSFAGSLIGIVTSKIFTITLVLGGIIIFIWYTKSE